MCVSNRKLLAGVLGGAAGSAAMKAIVHVWDPGAFGLSSQTDARAARALWGKDLGQESAERIGGLMHYALGIMAGVAYAAGTERYPVLRTGRGAVFGVALWLLGDELAVSVARLEKASAAKAGSHLAALAAHVLYGVTLDAVCSQAT